MNNEIRQVQRDINLTSEEKIAKIREIMLTQNKNNILKVQVAECNHYKRNCNLLTICCEKEYSCRLCHDEYEDHQINRFETKTIICRQCRTQQNISNKCVNKDCEITFANYFCEICRLWTDNNIDIFHCNGCGICNKGKHEDYVHCDTCKSCFRTSHDCVNGKTFESSCCGVCHQPIYQSTKEHIVPKCNHPIHTECLSSWLQNDNKCPFCKKSLVQINWNRFDEIIENQPMPEEYKKQVNIKCNDCEQQSDNVNFHFLGSKCGYCGGYNTIII
jgi:RING finger/CHY zinc finger protein 1